jgi:hypothetical protein
MSDAIIDKIVFLTLVRSPSERSCARFLIDSIRSFGGTLSHCPIWLFEADPQAAPCNSLESQDVRVFSLSVPDTVRRFYFADKVYACALAEEMAASAVQSLVWIDPACLIIRPPLLFGLDQSFDVAVRPVHIRNVGLPPTVPPDGFWRKIFTNVGAHDIESTVETFIEGQRIRSYFNSHAFASNPSTGLLRQWFECFETLVCDEEYQMDSCKDQAHQVFLHQAVLSTLLVTRLDPKRIRLLPPDYNYPYNLHQSVPLDRRAVMLNDLVCITYEDRSLDPRLVDDIDIHEPLRSWLIEHAAPNHSMERTQHPPENKKM